MKKHTVIYKDDKGALCEGFIITEKSARTLKAEGLAPNVVAITSSARVNHPSPAVMCAALKEMGVNLSDFYTVAEKYKAEANNDDNETDEGKESK